MSDYSMKCMDTHYEECADQAYRDYLISSFYDFLLEMKKDYMIPKLYTLPSDITTIKRFWEVA